LEQRIQEGFPEFLGKAIVYTLTQSDKLLNPTDIDGYADFSDLVDEVKAKVKKSLPDYLSAHIGIEMQSIVEEMRAQELELPEPIRIRSLPRQTQQQPINVTVNPANITLPSINIAAPVQEKKEDDMQIIINNNPENVDMGNKKSAEVLKSLTESILEIKNNLTPTPIVNVTVSPTPIEFTNEINPTPVQFRNEINVPAQPATIVNVEVNPTPVTVENTIVLPEKKKREIVIVKESENVWHGEAE
jgi:hypothetical protein